LLHSREYQERYSDNLSKELPRIPRVKSASDFWVFSRTGRDLADLHLNYETVTPYPANVIGSGEAEDCRVEKMKYGKKGKDKDLSTLIYNHKITVTGIPLEAHEYVVNGKPALDWVVERQCVKADEASGDWRPHRHRRERSRMTPKVFLTTFSAFTRRKPAQLIVFRNYL
jgi:predicted helicase